MKVRQAVILVGGQGTRMRPLTDSCPKPILPVLDRPCMMWLIDWFVKAGVEEVILACGYKSEQMESAIGDGSDLGIKITYSYEDKPLGPGGAIKLIEDRLDDVFMAMNGDVFYTDYDATKQIREHFESGAAVTMSLTTVPDPSQQGIVRVDENGNITEFKEKPKPEEMFSKQINAGVYVINKDILKFIPKDTFCDISRETFPLLISKGYRIHGTPIDGELIDVGRPKDLFVVNRIMAEKIHGSKNYLGRGTKAKDSRLAGSVIHDDCDIEDSVVEDSLIMDGCIIKGAKVRNCVIGMRCTITKDVSDQAIGFDKTI